LALSKSLSVLLVEDEVLILEIVQDALEQAGFRVQAVPSSFAALEYLSEGVADLAGLVTDIRLGEGPNGWDLARHARQDRPDLPVIYMTGDSAADWPVQGVPRSKVVQKPFAVAQIVTALSAMTTQVDTGAAGHA
jgi:two-component system cell cycle response regulator CpdR